MRRSIAGLLALAFVFAAATGSARAALFCKAYAFKPNTVLQVGVNVDEGLRLDSVEFVVPTDDGSPAGLFDGPRVKVAISNLGDKSIKVGIAVAVLDGDSRLLGVASGGTKLFPLRADRQMTYVLDIDGVNGELAAGTVFRISVEPKR